MDILLSSVVGLTFLIVGIALFLTLIGWKYKKHLELKKHRFLREERRENLEANLNAKLYKNTWISHYPENIVSCPDISKLAK